MRRFRGGLDGLRRRVEWCVPGLCGFGWGLGAGTGRVPWLRECGAGITLYDILDVGASLEKPPRE